MKPNGRAKQDPKNSESVSRYVNRTESIRLAGRLMKLKRLAVQNVRSFGEKRTIEFHDDFTILIGPNAGGKSNLLDIITVGVRKFFVRPWGLMRHEDATGPSYNFTSEDPFANFSEETEIRWCDWTLGYRIRLGP